jgi:hypothetical protein
MSQFHTLTWLFNFGIFRPHQHQMKTIVYPNARLARKVLKINTSYGMLPISSQRSGYNNE